MPSRSSAGETEDSVDHEITKLILAVLDHRDKARLAEPTTSLPGLMCGPGESNEFDRVTSTVRRGHLIRLAVWVIGSSSENSRVSKRPGLPAFTRSAKIPIVNNEYRMKV